MGLFFIGRIPSTGKVMYALLKNLCDALTAASQYLKQTHLCAADGGHAVHELTQQIYEHLDDNTDRIKELSIIIFGDRSVAIAANSLSSAATFCKNIPSNLDTEHPMHMVKNCVDVLVELGDLVEKVSDRAQEERFPFKQGILNALGDISERLARDTYLLNMEIK